jgi:hypothetical protein
MRIGELVERLHDIEIKPATTEMATRDMVCEYLSTAFDDDDEVADKEKLADSLATELGVSFFVVGKLLDLAETVW